jgi:hypothetical protein
MSWGTFGLVPGQCQYQITAAWHLGFSGEKEWDTWRGIVMNRNLLIWCGTGVLFLFLFSVSGYSQVLPEDPEGIPQM